MCIYITLKCNACFSIVQKEGNAEPLLAANRNTYKQTGTLKEDGWHQLQVRLLQG